MHIYDMPSKVKIPVRPRSVALGLFDGLHAGHRQVILAAMQTETDRIARCVYTFTTETVTTKEIPGRLCSLAEEQALLTEMGVDEWFRADFSAVRQLSPAAFVRDVLHTALGAVQVVCGYNYRFGAGGTGDAALLTALCAEYGIAVRVVPAVLAEQTPISSTAIRRALAAGDMALYRRLLGRPYCLTQPVERGQQLGRRMGLPTINQPLPADRAMPCFGVYASCVQIGTAVYPAVTNIGVRPTVGAPAPLAETYLLHFDGDLYGTAPTVYPLRYLRPERAFSSLAALQAQIEEDARQAEALFAPSAASPLRAVFFDFDDTLDDRDAALRYGLSVFLSHYYPALSPAERAQRREQMFTYRCDAYGHLIDYPALVAHFLALWPPQVPVDPDRAVWRFYHAFAAGGMPEPDVLPTLAALRERGYLIGIITNGHRIPQTCKLDHSALRAYVDLTVLAGQEGIAKPDPALFRLAAARLGLPPRACLYVGDHPDNDIRGAQAAGFATLGRVRERAPEHPIHRLTMPAGVPLVRHIGEVLTLLEHSPT